MNNPHWSTGLTKLEIAKQLLTGLNQDDGELLEMVEVFNDVCLDDDIASELCTIKVLNQYVIPHQNNITIELTPTHIKIIHAHVDDWVCEYHEKGRND